MKFSKVIRKKKNKRQRKTDHGRENEKTKLSVRVVGPLIGILERFTESGRDNYQRNNRRKLPRTERCLSAD